MSALLKRLPSWAQVLGFLGIVSTILGIISFFVGDLSGRSQGLSEQQIVATLAAMQEGRQQAELQLTQIAVDNERAANQQTQAANQIELQNVQATLNAFQAEQQAFVSTQNALAAASATADALIVAATDQAATQQAVATQQALDLTATQAWLDQITPTPTDLPTPTPPPTITPTPEPVVDYRALIGATVEQALGRQILFTVQTSQPIPETPPEGLSYVFSLDVDSDPTTGLALNDIGVDRRVLLRYTDGGWGGVVRAVAADGTLGEPFVFAEIRVIGDRAAALVNPRDVGLPDAFYWVVRAELGGETYSLLPQTGHFTYDGR